MICEIINPSDPYTLKTEDFVCAAVAIAILGRGNYGLKCFNDGQVTPSTPILFGWDEWFKEQGIDDLTKYIFEHEQAMADILDTVIIGNAKDREEVEATLLLLPEDEREHWLSQRHHNRRCSSLNDIGKAAKAWAMKLRSV